MILSSYVLNVYNYLDSNNTERSAIYVDQPVLGLTRSTLTAGDDNSTAPVLNAYRQYAQAAAGAVRDWLRTNVSDADIVADVEAIIQFEADIANVIRFH